MINELNKSIQEQEELQQKLSRSEWKSMDKNEQTKLEQQIAFNEKKQGLYIMRASKTIISILHRGFKKIKQDGKVMLLDEKSAEKLYSHLHLVESDEGTYKVAFENDSKKYKDILSPTNKWLAPNAYLKIFGKKFIKDMGFDTDKPRSGTTRWSLSTQNAPGRRNLSFYLHLPKLVYVKAVYPSDYKIFLSSFVKFVFIIG